MAKIVSFDNNTVIDMGVMQELANAINAHDDILVDYTNSISGSILESMDETNMKRAFDLSVSAIYFGKARVTVTDGFADGTIDFTTNFLNPPIVIASVGHGTKGVKYYLSTFNVTENGFDYAAERFQTSTSADGSIYINWVAIGDRVG